MPKHSEIIDVCKYRKSGCEGGMGGTWVMTCRHADNIPEGHSWGKCNDKVCPITNKGDKCHA